MREQYDFSKGVRGKYTDRLAKGVKLVDLDPDVAEAFPTSEEVNEALRRLAEERAQAKPAGDAGSPRNRADSYK